MQLTPIEDSYILQPTSSGINSPRGTLDLKCRGCANGGKNQNTHKIPRASSKPPKNPPKQNHPKNPMLNFLTLKPLFNKFGCTTFIALRGHFAPQQFFTMNLHIVFNQATQQNNCPNLFTPNHSGIEKFNPQKILHTSPSL